VIVVHSSAVLTLLTNEPGCNAVAAKLCDAADAIMSPVSVMDVLQALTPRYDDPSPILTAFLRQSHIAQRSIDAAQTSWARTGFLAYGAGRWSLADCFAYGAAKALDAPLLATTDIFAKSDLKMV
jgi:ribonuclease VapC